MFLVSACLVGCLCRYDGRRAPNEELIAYLSDKKWMAVCPEQLGGLPTPRPPAKIAGGTGKDVLDGKARVVTVDGEDVTQSFVAGAQAVLELAGKNQAEACLLKDKSPSCGLQTTSCVEGLTPGAGVTAALLEREGYKVIEITASSKP
jgi:uncharacterized protein YbbK (DUF523 family)